MQTNLLHLAGGFGRKITETGIDIQDLPFSFLAVLDPSSRIFPLTAPNEKETIRLGPALHPGRQRKDFHIRSSQVFVSGNTSTTNASLNR